MLSVLVDVVVAGSLFFFSSRRRHTRYIGDWSSDVCSSDLILAIARSVGLHIDRQRQTNANHADQYKMMQRTMHLTLGILYRITQRARFFVRSPCAGTVQRQTDEAAVLEGLVALGLVQRGRQSQSRRLRVHALGAVGQGIIPELACQAQLCAHG